jgi:hypothetical protein
VKVDTLFNYTEQSDYESGLRIARVMSRRERDLPQNQDMVPTPPKNKLDADESETRSATYVSVYGEYAYLFIEESGAGLSRVTEILKSLGDAGIDPYQVEEVTQRRPDSISINSTECGYRVIDRNEATCFSTDFDSNPHELS